MVQNGLYYLIGSIDTCVSMYICNQEVGCDVVSGTILLTMCENICTDVLGACDNDKGCKSACNSKQPGGQAHCNIVGSTKLCFCSYTCPPPSKLQRGSCTENLGACDNSCKDKCIAKHLAGQGKCVGNPTSLCECTYPC